MAWRDSGLATKGALGVGTEWRLRERRAVSCGNRTFGSG